MKVKIVLRRLGGKHVVYIYPETEYLRWYVTDTSPKTGKTINFKETKLNWDNVPDCLRVYITDISPVNFREKQPPDWDGVLKALCVDVPPMKEALWSATVLEL